jgi:hypothetical protein
MKDLVLEQQPLWRYCRVRTGEKRPYPNNWQNMPLTLAEVDSGNIGLILGPKGNGICAIDFDGPTAIDWFNREIGCALPDTPAWSSGREGRMQMAFLVEAEFWQYLSTKKITTGEGEGFEFRWAGGQSVLPPSIHPVTGKPYTWLIPGDTQVARIPAEILEYWVKLCNQEHKPEDLTPEVNLDDLVEDDVKEAERLLKKLKETRAILDYDTWRTVSWALAHYLGRDAARFLINLYYPEQRAGEYNQIFRTWNKAKSPTLATIKHMVGESKMHRQEQHHQQYQQHLQRVDEMEQIRQEIERRKQNDKHSTVG